jgi:hypothetical protein
MRFWRLQLAWASVAVLALAVTLFVRRGVLDVLVMILIGGSLVGMYLLRRYARAELLYRRHETPPPAAPLDAEPVGNAPDLAEATRPDPAVPALFTPGLNDDRPVRDRDIIAPGASLQCR